MAILCSFSLVTILHSSLLPEPTYMYKTVNGRELPIEMNYPDDWKPGDKRPAILFFYGGGFSGGATWERHPQAVYFAKRGMVCARAYYRVKSREGVTPDKCIEDAVSAMRWFRGNADMLGIDPDRIATFGGSAGGTLAGAPHFIKGVESSDDDKSISPEPNAMVMLFPAVRFRPQSVNGDEELARRISIMENITGTTPPTLLMYSSDDFLWPDGKIFYEKLKEKNAHVEMYFVYNIGHGYHMYKPWLGRTTRRADEFFQTIGWLGREPEVPLPQVNLAMIESYAKNPPKEPAKEVIYKEIGDRKLTMQVSYPPDWKHYDRRAAIVFFFGGGWTTGTTAQFHPQAEYFARRGLVCFRADYRVRSRDGVLPHECVEDAKSAVSWIRQHALDMGIDPNSIIAAGGSAGGHIAACTHFTEGTGRAGSASKPNALILYNPALDFTGTDNQGNPLAGRRDLAQALSPLRQVHPHIPPTIMLFGTEDFLYDQLISFYVKEKDLGAPISARIVKGQGHGFFNRTPWLERTTLWVDEFLQDLGYLDPEPNVELPAKNEEMERMNR